MSRSREWRFSKHHASDQSEEFQSSHSDPLAAASISEQSKNEVWHWMCSHWNRHLVERDIDSWLGCAQRRNYLHCRTETRADRCVVRGARLRHHGKKPLSHIYTLIRLLLCTDDKHFSHVILQFSQSTRIGRSNSNLFLRWTLFPLSDMIVSLLIMLINTRQINGALFQRFETSKREARLSKILTLIWLMFK